MPPKAARGCSQRRDRRRYRSQDLRTCQVTYRHVRPGPVTLPDERQAGLSGDVRERSRRSGSLMARPVHPRQAAALRGRWLWLFPRTIHPHR